VEQQPETEKWPHPNEPFVCPGGIGRLLGWAQGLIF
jgi:hypothetical protein